MNVLITTRKPRRSFRADIRRIYNEFLIVLVISN